MSQAILAAGTVCWRRVGAEIMVLLVHRTRQRDVSFPKGKLDPGESMPRAAVRETLEETGLAISLGANLGTIHYLLPNGAEKTVQYWAAEVTEEAVQRSHFVPNGEIAALEWVPLAEVPERLSYPADRELFEVFTRLVARGALDTFSVLLLRHAKAEARSPLWPEDHLRPLSDDGELQADNLVPILEAFGPRRIYSSSAERCVRTVQPLAEHLSAKIRIRDGLSQDAWDAGETAELRQIIGKVVRKARNAIICTHRPVLPDAARELALATGTVPGAYLQKAASLPPGAFSVFHFSVARPGSGILSVETYPLKH